MTTTYAPPPRHTSVAREAAGVWVGNGLARAAATVRSGVDALAEVELDTVDELQIRSVLGELHRDVRRIQAHISALATQLTSRQAQRLNPEDPEDGRTRQRAERDIQNELADTLNVTHSEAKDAVAAGGALQKLSAQTRAAFADGAITARHARQIADTARALLGVVDSEQLEPQLLDRARELNVTEFGRHCRDLVARHSTEQAQRDIDRLRQRRYGSVTTDASGMVHVRAGFVGVDAEVVQTAIETFRTKDQPGDLRSTTQRTSDAIFEVFNHALRHAESTDHGNRPHVFVHVDADQLDRPDTGVAETTFTGTLPLTELGPILDDAIITRIVRDSDGQVVDVGRATRVVPSSVWRGVLARDRRCTMCGAPPQRCQAAHLDRRWLHGAGVSIPELALLCWTCHRRADGAHLTGRLEHHTVTWYRRDGTPYQRFPHRFRRRT